jgi:hypothetical protein
VGIRVGLPTKWEASSKNRVMYFDGVMYMWDTGLLLDVSHVRSLSALSGDTGPNITAAMCGSTNSSKNDTAEVMMAKDQTWLLLHM